MKPKLAIVIPYYKIDFFEDTIASLANQTDKRFKVYIGNDASDSDPSQVLKKFQKDINFQFTNFKTNLGSISLTHQWERCIKLVDDEEWVMILGDDDTLNSNIVASFYHHYDKFINKSHVIRFSTVTIFEDSERPSELFEQPTWESPYDSYYRRITGENRSSLSEYIFTLEKYKEYGFVNYPLAWHSDDRAWLDFSENLPIYSINDSRVYIRMSSINISGKIDNLESKKCASLLFYKYLVKNKLENFNKIQREVIIHNYEKCIFKTSKLNYKHFFYLFSRYIKTGRFTLVVRLLKNVMKRI